jgi:pyrroline-5-carboxylate reductase
MIGVIGCGNMASAIVKGIHKKFNDERFLTYTPSFTRAEALASAVGGSAVKELKDLAECPVVIMACKPQQFNELASNLKKSFNLKETYFISIMAAISIETISEKLGVAKVTRIMPNTPSLLGEGVSLMLHSTAVTDEWQKKCTLYFSACSEVFLLNDEKKFDQVTTVTGSGPAYVFEFAKTMADQLESWGIAKSESRKMISKLFTGAAKLMEDNTDKALSQLIDEVTSKGGVTIEAVKVYEESGLTAITQKALAAALKRSEVLTKELSQS